MRCFSSAMPALSFSNCNRYHCSRARALESIVLMLSRSSLYFDSMLSFGEFFFELQESKNVTVIKKVAMATTDKIIESTNMCFISVFLSDPFVSNCPA